MHEPDSPEPRDSGDRIIHQLSFIDLTADLHTNHPPILNYAITKKTIQPRAGSEGKHRAERATNLQVEPAAPAMVAGCERRDEYTRS